MGRTIFRRPFILLAIFMYAQAIHCFHEKDDSPVPALHGRVLYTAIIFFHFELAILRVRYSDGHHDGRHAKKGNTFYKSFSGILSLGSIYDREFFHVGHRTGSNRQRYF